MTITGTTAARETEAGLQRESPVSSAQVVHTLLRLPMPWAPPKGPFLWAAAPQSPLPLAVMKKQGQSLCGQVARQRQGEDLQQVSSSQPAAVPGEA